MFAMTQWLPVQASTSAEKVDQVFLLLVAVTGALFLLISVLLVWFGVKYHGSRAADREPRRQSIRLEAVLVGVPTVLGLGIFAFAALAYVDVQTAPPGTLEVYGIGRQWMWKFQHPSGRREINSLHVPVGHPVRVTLISQDVIHCFSVPAFRIKQDVLPARYTQVWFEATKPGTYELFCDQYCGAEHALMIGKVTVMEEAAFQRWLGQGPVASPADASLARPPLREAGEGTFFRLGCNACHVPNDDSRAPRLEGLFGGEVKLRNGDRLIADAQYVRTAILRPNAHIVAGYASPSLMPTYKDQVTESEILELVEYVKSLQPEFPAEEK